MGLDTTHDVWHGAYRAFYRLRHNIARDARDPPRAMSSMARIPVFCVIEFAALPGPDGDIYAVYPRGDRK